jgi:hypothetical protein
MRHIVVSISFGVEFKNKSVGDSILGPECQKLLGLADEEKSEWMQIGRGRHGSGSPACRKTWQTEGVALDKSLASDIHGALLGNCLGRHWQL